MFRLDKPEGEYIYGNGEHQVKFEYEPFYVGKGFGKRWKNHFRDKSLLKKSIKNSILVKLLKLNFKKEDISKIFKSSLTEFEALELEKNLIKTIGRRDKGLGPLTNMTDGGDGVSGGSIEYRKSQGIKRRGTFTENQIIACSSRPSKASYKVTSPKQEIYYCDNLVKFSEENNLDPSSMSKTARGLQKHHKNWNVEIITDLKNNYYNGNYELTNLETNIKYTTNSLNKFCKDRNLSSLFTVVDTDKDLLGWKCKKIGDVDPTNLTDHYENPRLIYNYYLFDENVKQYKTDNLRKFCRDNNLNPSGLKIIMGDFSRHCNGWRIYSVLKTEESNVNHENYLEEIKKYIKDGKLIRINHSLGLKHSDASKEKIKKSKEKEVYHLISPNNEEFETKRLPEFALKYNIDENSLRKVALGEQSHHKGWICSIKGKEYLREKIFKNKRLTQYFDNRLINS